MRARARGAWIALIVGCAAPAAPARPPAVSAVSIEQLDAMLARRAGTAVDANGERARDDLGVIPGAVLLTDFAAFAASELPADRAWPLVFYCVDSSCRASDLAAGRAIAGGHTDVHVLPEGIVGWVAAGKPVRAP